MLVRVLECDAVLWIRDRQKCRQHFMGKKKDEIEDGLKWERPGKKSRGRLKGIPTNQTGRPGSLLVLP